MNLYDHKPVLVQEIIDYFAANKLRIFFDGTVGAGGHAAAILTAHSEIEKYIGCDQDVNALQLAKKRLLPFAAKVHLVHGNFQDLDRHLAKQKADGILLDLGVSSMQLNNPERGFSFQKEGPLDMRMDQDNSLTAEKVINECREIELTKIFRELGEEKRARAAARRIVQARQKKRIKTTQELVAVLQTVLPQRSYQKIHPATRIFQALRIFVNKELDVLQQTLLKATDCLNVAGRMGVISFHSLEDRIVKHTFRRLAQKPVANEPCIEILTKKPLVASRQEQKLNPRSRSAKLRFVERVIYE